MDECTKDGVFDQFENKKTTYNFDIYSTKIDENKVSKDVESRAEKIERDLMNEKAVNRHQAEERNQIQLKDEGEYEDEEARYGAVDRRNKMEKAAA